MISNYFPYFLMISNVCDLKINKVNDFYSLFLKFSALGLLQDIRISNILKKAQGCKFENSLTLLLLFPMELLYRIKN